VLCCFSTSARTTSNLGSLTVLSWMSLQQSSSLSMGEGKASMVVTCVDIGCLCTSYCPMWHIFSDYFSYLLSRLIRWSVAFVLHCFSLFALFVYLKFSCPKSLLFSLWHWAQGLYSVALLIIQSLTLGTSVLSCGISEQNSAPCSHYTQGNHYKACMAKERCQFI